MARLENVSVETLEDALDEASGRREIYRVMAAILYKRGPSAPMIAAWLDTREQTVYRWFDRLESEPIEQAISDRPRSGRPAKLSDADAEAFREIVRNPPAEAGYDRPAWTTALAQQLLEAEFGVAYTRRHVQRLLKDAGLAPQTTRPGPSTGDEDERTDYWRPVTTAE